MLRLAAETAWGRGGFAASLESWKRLAALDTDETAYQWKICRCLAEAGRQSRDAAVIAQAVAAGRDAVRATKSQDPDALAALAQAYRAQGELEAALATIRKATRFKCAASAEYEELEARYSKELRERK